MIIEFSVNANKSFGIRKETKLFNKIILIISVIACTFSLETASATTYYVDPNGSDDANGLTWPTAFETIQKAIDTANDNDIIDVNAGTYYESIDFSGKAVSIRSLDPSNPQVVAETVIDGNNADKVITFDDSEDANSIVSGFTIKGGGTGIYCFESSPIIDHCIIRDNNDSGMVNIKLSEPNIIDSVFYLNSAKYGAGMHNFQSSPGITNCIFSQNTASSRGGGIYNSFSSPVVINCTFSNNAASTSAGGMFSSISSAVVKNSIFWGNSAGFLGDEICNDNSDPNFSYCDVEGSGGSSSWDPNFGANNGGNIDSNPWFFNANNPLGSDNIFNTIDDGLRLKASSACIDAADGNSAPSIDIMGQARIDVDYVENTGIGDPNYTDVGAYEFMGDSDGDGMPDDWEDFYGLDPNTNDADDDLDTDGYSNLSEYLHSSDPNDDSSEPSINITINVPYDVSTIQRAIDTSIDGDTVEVSEGTYYEKITFNGKSVLVTSIKPDDVNTVASTIIDANDTSNSSYVVTFDSGEDGNSILNGISITGGYTGIYCDGTVEITTSPKIMNCIILGNAAYGIHLHYSCSPNILKCTISNNGSNGIWVQYGNAFANVVSCDISRNSKGVHCQFGSAVISDSTIISNSDRGISCQNAIGATGYVTVTNCTIARNSYGLSVAPDEPSTIANCTIFDNTTCGIFGSCEWTTVKNCIFWNNGDDISDNMTSGCVTYCCNEDNEAGLGNFKTDPCFIDADSNNFHLDLNSSCIDRGEPWADYSNEPPFNGNRLNLGRYGNTSEATPTTDEDGDGLSDAWELYYFGSLMYDSNSNPDNDDFTNKSEYLFGYDPNSYTDEPMFITQENISVSQFDPTNNENVIISYWINMDANSDVSFTSNDTSANLDDSVSAGYNEAVWCGKDSNELIVLDGLYDVNIDANDGQGHSATSNPGEVEVNYVHDIDNLVCNPYRILPLNREISTISYEITTDAYMIVEVYDPCGVLFTTLLNFSAQQETNNPQQLTWHGLNGSPEDPNSRYISKEGEYLIRVRFAGMQEKKETTVTAYK
jgi:parallel beta-helix repeat protein